LGAALAVCAPASASEAGRQDGGAHRVRPKQPILLEADQVEYDTRNNIVTARGNVHIADQERVLLADSVSYNQNTKVVTADGNVRLMDPDGNVAFAEHVELTDDLREGALRGFQALIGPNGRLAATTAERHEGRYTTARGAVFTPCKICRETGDTTPVWQVRAARVTHDQVEKEVVFRDATLEFMGVSVAYLPFFSTPDPTVQHQSGFLRPSFGTSSDLGTILKVPYYWSVTPSLDFTFEPQLTTEAGDRFSAEYRQRWANGGGMWLQGSIGYDGDANAIEHEWMSHLFGSGRIPLGGGWRAGFDVQLTSNDTYLRRYDISNYDRLTTDIFVDHVSGRSRFAATGYYFQGLRATDVAARFPYVLPLAEYTYIPDDRIATGRLRVDASALALYRVDGTDTLRGSVSVDWWKQFITDTGHVISFEAMIRGDAYWIKDGLLANPPAPDDDFTTSRGLAVAVAEWRWPFVRENSFGNANLVIEPIVQFVAAPYGGNPPTIPNEDSTGFAFDETNLFNIDVFPGLDRWSGGPRVNAGARVTAIWPSGLVEAIVGQEYRWKADHSFPPSLGIGDEDSDIVGRLKIQFPPYVQLIHRWRVDPETASVRDNEIYLSARYGRSAIDVSYLKLSEQQSIDPTLLAREEVNLLGSLNVYGNWSVFGMARRDLENAQMIETRAGLSYEDECFLATVGYRRRYTRDRDLEPGTSIILTIGLKTGLDESSIPGMQEIPRRNLPL
jgi:LPS-assembly protein